MITLRTIASFALMAGALAACSSDGGGTTAGGSNKGAIAVINSTQAAKGATLTLDATPATLPAYGTSGTIATSPGAHVLTLTSATGHPLATASIMIDSGIVAVATLSGADTVIVSVTPGRPASGSAPGDSVTLPDTVGTFPDQPHGSALGFLLLGNATGVTEDIQVAMVGTDSIERFSFQGSGPNAYWTAYMPATYTIDILAHNSTVSQAHATITIAAGDRWNAHIAKASDGTVTLTTTKQ